MVFGFYFVWFGLESVVVRKGGGGGVVGKSWGMGSIKEAF